MISDPNQYQKAQEELQFLEEWLAKLQQEQDNSNKGLTKAGIRKMIARLHEELAIYEGRQEVMAAKP
jgi:hypothetical protein